MIRALLILIAVATPAAGQSGPAAQGELRHRWRMTPGQLRRDQFAPQAGSVPARVVGPVRFSREAPRGLELSGDRKSKHRLLIADDHSTLGLPSETITVDAWARVDKPLEWGGIVGCLQDNGSFERGWILGFRKSTFCFGIASESKKKFTYLTSRRMFEPGYWYHVAGTYDGKKMRLFVDGKLVAESGEQQGPVAYPPAARFVIGAYEDKDELFLLKGAVEQVSVWGRALSREEVATEFQSRQKLFPGIVAVHPDVADWPTHLRDNQRTGIATHEMRVPLHLRWVHKQRKPPAPAWPAPASQDFWHKKFNLKARVVYDRASHVVSAKGRVFFGSSSEDKITCLDLRSGETQWEFFTEGPVRLSPTVVGNRVLVGSDDGYVYCLNAATGRLIWKHRGVDDPRRIPGNERIISVWPIRTGVLVDENVAYFCAGLFPQQGVYQVAVDLKSGKRLGEAKLDISAQGYLARRSGRLFVATGRDPAGAFVSKLKRTGKGVGRELAAIPDKYRDVFIGSKNLRFGGGAGEVAAFDVTDGRQLWYAKVHGKAWSMAVVGPNLLVSTDTGHIYCFGEQTDSAQTHEPTKAIAKADPGTKNAVSELVAKTSVMKGYALVLHGTSAVADELARQTELNIVCLNPSAADIHESRQATSAAGLGGRVTYHRGDPSQALPYSDYLFNLVIDERALGKRRISRTAEIERVTRPLGGIAVTGPSEKDTFVRGALPGTGEWSHMYANPANTVCSNDEHVGSDLQLHWFGRPGPQQMLDRHHRTVAPVWKNGRLFIPGNDRVIGVDAYNGTPLWNVAIPGSRRIGAYRDSSYLASADDSVFVAAKRECLVLDAQTGEIKQRLVVPGSDHEWGYLAVDGNSVIGTASKPGAIRRDHGLDAINEGTFWDARPLVTSDAAFHIDSAGDNEWSYLPAEGVIVNSSLTVSNEHVFLVESTNPKTREVADGRVKPEALFSKGSRVTALNREGGSVAWSVDLGLEKIEHNLHCAFADGKLIVVGSRNSSDNKKTGEVLYDVYVVNATNGDIIWKTTQKQGTKIGGDHGEQDHHPVIVGDTLYCEPFAYKLNTGEPLKDFAWAKKHRRGCGTVSASSSAFYFRQSNPTLFDLKTGEYRKVTATTRPGCWINMIPAGGLLLIPEASSGCTCNYSIQTSLAFLPRKPNTTFKPGDD